MILLLMISIMNNQNDGKSLITFFKLSSGIEYTYVSVKDSKENA